MPTNAAPNNQNVIMSAKRRDKDNISNSIQRKCDEGKNNNPHFSMTVLA
jgi:hypothetical protein